MLFVTPSRHFFCSQPRLFPLNVPQSSTCTRRGSNRLECRSFRHASRSLTQTFTQSHRSLSSSLSEAPGRFSHIRSPCSFHQQRRCFSILPESFSIWGGSGAAITAIHSVGMPHWACFAVISVAVRTALFPLVLYGAKTSTRFAKIVPEVQFLLSIFRADLQRLRKKGAPLKERVGLMRTNLSTLGGLYKLHNVKPWAIFLSPLIQLPIFWYVSVDLRKIVNGLDPTLAQSLVDNGVAWIPDLTEPDPWFGLPVLAGLLMYLNVETALGRRSLSGPAAAKADTGVLLKDIFQSVAVFMPCFTSQLASGVQVYLTTSFTFTLLQSAALRQDTFRSVFGLPSINAAPPDAKYAQQFIRLKELEQKAKEVRGDGPLLGTGVLAMGLECSFPGTRRPSSIEGSGNASKLPTWEKKLDLEDPKDIASLLPKGTPLIHGITAPLSTLRERREESQVQLKIGGSDDEDYMPQVDDDMMVKANRGEFPAKIAPVLPKARVPSTAAKVDVKRLQRKRQGRGRNKR